MTVIAWDGKMLAADKRGVNSGAIMVVTKIKEINGHLVGSSGDFSAANTMMEWYKNGANIEKYPECQKDKDRWVSLVIVTPEKKIFRYEQDVIPFEIEQEKYAFGSGRDFAMAAMEMGADAKKAVLIASKYDSGCGNGVDTLTFKKK